MLFSSVHAAETDATEKSVDPIKVYTEKELIREIEKIASTLVPEKDWSIRIAAMQRIEGLVYGGLFPSLSCISYHSHLSPSALGRHACSINLCFIVCHNWCWLDTTIVLLPQYIHFFSFELYHLLPDPSFLTILNCFHILMNWNLIYLLQVI